MSKKKKGEPDRFQWLPTDPGPADAGAVADALRAFVQQFVVPAKRDRAELFLLSNKKRDKGLRDLWAWLDEQYTEDLEGSTGFPQHLEERFNGVQGFFVDSERCLTVTLPEASVLATDVALFMSFDKMMAMLFAEIGTPTLCTAPIRMAR